jgi:CHASE2 domain-containing sensor protein
MPDPLDPGNTPEPDLLEALAAGELKGDARLRAEELIESSESARDFYRRLTALRFPQITNYTIVEQVGKGGFGVVYKAVHHATERVEALKILFAKTPLLTSYFENEVHLIARLRHPNIATLYDAQLSTPPLYYTMDFVEGERLNDYVKTHELSLAERIEIIKRVALAIGYAHSQGVIHRDIKPPNILIDAQRQPHIVDFGIAKRLRLQDPAAESPEYGSADDSRVGTVGYIAPEVVSGGRSDERVDVFALGALLFHCITLEPARLARDPHHRFELLRARRVSQPEDLSAIIARCVEKDPADRYGSCEDLIADLDNYLAGRAIRARRDRSLGERINRIAALMLRNHNLALRVAAVFGVALLLTWLLSKTMTRRNIGGATAGKYTALIGITPESIDAISRGELAAGLPTDVRESIDRDPFSWRPLHGLLMERLAEAGPAVVVWDVAFRGESELGDPILIRGVKALEARGIPVVIGAAAFSKNAEPDVSKAIRDAVHTCATLASVTDRSRPPTDSPPRLLENEYVIVHAFQRGFEPAIPGLAAAAFAAARFPGCYTVIELDQAQRSVLIKYRKRNPVGNESRWEDETDRLMVQNFHRIERDWVAANVLNNVFQAGDVVAQGRVTAAPPAEWQNSALPYHTAFALDPHELRERLNGKAVVIAQMHAPIDVKFTSRGDEIFGCIVHAQAIETLLSGPDEGYYNWQELGAQCLLWSAAAVIFVSVLRSRRWTSLVIPKIVCAAMIVVGLTLASYATRRVTEVWVFQLTIAVSAMLMAGGLAFLIKIGREFQMQMAPAGVTWSAESENLPSTILAPGE